MTRITYPTIDGREFACRHSTTTTDIHIRLALSAGTGHVVTDEISADLALNNISDDSRVPDDMDPADRTAWTNDVLQGVVDNVKPVIARKNDLDPESVEVEAVTLIERDEFRKATPNE